MTQNGAANPALVPLTSMLRERGVKVLLSCRLSSLVDLVRMGNPRMKELQITAPLFAFHRLHEERRMAIGIGVALEPWRRNLLRRGINLLSVTEDGLYGNPGGIADKVCEHIYRVRPEDLLEMIEAHMPLVAIEAFTGIPQRKIAWIIPRFYGRSLQEIREEAAERP